MSLFEITLLGKRFNGKALQHHLIQAQLYSQALINLLTKTNELQLAQQGTPYVDHDCNTSNYSAGAIGGFQLDCSCSQDKLAM